MILTPRPPSVFNEENPERLTFFAPRQARYTQRRATAKMRGSPPCGTAVGCMLLLLLLDALLLLAGQAAGEGIITNHVVVRLHESAHDDAHQLAVEHGFQSVRKVKTRETKYCSSSNDGNICLGFFVECYTWHAGSVVQRAST